MLWRSICEYMVEYMCVSVKYMINCVYSSYIKPYICSAVMCEIKKIDACIHLHTSPYIEVMLQFTLTHSLSLCVTE